MPLAHCHLRSYLQFTHRALPSGLQGPKEAPSQSATCPSPIS